MTARKTDPLLLAGKVLTIFIQVLLALSASVLVVITPLVIFFQDKISAEIQAENPDLLAAFPTMPIVGLFLCIIAILALAFLFFGKLRAIIDTVGESDPFVPENAHRLTLMAWLLLAVQVMMIPVAGLGLLVAKWADQLEHGNINIDAGLDLDGILMVIVLFILARVFKLGAAMREDLEGTV